MFQMIGSKPYWFSLLVLLCLLLASCATAASTSPKVTESVPQERDKAATPTATAIMRNDVPTGPVPSVTEKVLTDGKSMVTPTVSSEANSTPAQVSNDYPFYKLLRFLPDLPETRTRISLEDYALARETFSIKLPASDADYAELQEYYLAVVEKTGLSGEAFPAGSHTYWLAKSRNQRQNLGFDFRETDQSAAVPNLGLGPISVALGRYDPQATDMAIKACSECPIPPTYEQHLGVQFYSWGEDHAQNLRWSFKPPAFDRLGRGGRLAVQDNFVLRTTTTETMEWMIEAYQGRRPSLADTEENQLLLHGLELVDVFTVQVFVNAEQLSAQNIFGEVGPNLRSEVEKYLLRPYQVAAEGRGKDDRGTYLAVALVHNDAKLAAQNVTLLEERIQNHTINGVPLREMLEEVEIWSEGRLLLAKLRGANFAKSLPGMLVSFGVLAHE